MPLNKKISAFETELSGFCLIHDLKSEWWTGMPRAQILEVCGPANVLMYVKESDGRKGVWWGVTTNVYNELCASARDWWLVLLAGGEEEGYVLTATTLKGMISGLSRNRKETQYYVHEPNIPAGSHFTSFDELYRRLLTTPEQAGAIEALIAKPRAPGDPAPAGQRHRRG